LDDPARPGDDDAWFEIRLIGEDGEPIPRERYDLVTADGRVHAGFLDDDGVARVYSTRAGIGDLTFPDLDEHAWERA